MIYLYGIAPAEVSDPPSTLLGVEGQPVVVERMGEVAAILSEVPAAEYATDRLNAHLEEVAWVGERGLAHERVLAWFVDQGPVLPLRLFSLHRDHRSLAERIRDQDHSMQRALDKLHGKQEWGVRLWRREAEALEGVDRLSPALGELAQEIERAPAGKRFLLVKKRESLRTSELRALSHRLSREVHRVLREHASENFLGALPAGAPGSERLLLLDAAYLVAESRFAEFQAALTRYAAPLAGSGFEIEFTGPWPAYHFSGLSEDE